MKISYSQSLEHLAIAGGKRILVVGDLMLDKYIWGKVERISPEAPVPVVEIQREEVRLGGAANVALNLKALGAEPILCGMIGDDVDGKTLIRLMEEAGLVSDAIITDAARPTTSKTRILGNSHQMLRVDREQVQAASPSITRTLLEVGQHWMQQSEGIILQDYDKGVLHQDCISQLMAAAHALGKPVFVDPKRKQFLSYSGAHVFKPNLKELNEGLGISLTKDDFSGMCKAIVRLRQEMPHNWTFLTLSENGILIMNPAGTAYHMEAHKRSIADVSGAGDTVIATMAFAAISGIDILHASALANLAGGLVCETAGVVPVQMHQLLKEVSRLQSSEFVVIEA